jgi:hypothetical protein
MSPTPPHLQDLEEIERAGIPGLVEVLREEGIDGVRYALWDATGWHRDFSPLPGATGLPSSRSGSVGRWR